MALDGNLTQALLAEIARSPLFAAADLRVAPASPGKAERLAPLLAQPNATIYVNLEEAGILCQRSFAGAEGRSIGSWRWRSSSIPVLPGTWPYSRQATGQSQRNGAGGHKDCVTETRRRRGQPCWTGMMPRRG